MGGWLVGKLLRGGRQSFEALSACAVAAVVDPVQIVKVGVEGEWVGGWGWVSASWLGGGGCWGGGPGLGWVWRKLDILSLVGSFVMGEGRALRRSTRRAVAVVVDPVQSVKVGPAGRGGRTFLGGPGPAVAGSDSWDATARGRLPLAWRRVGARRFLCCLGSQDLPAPVSTCCCVTPPLPQPCHTPAGSHPLSGQGCD